MTYEEIKELRTGRFGLYDSEISELPGGRIFVDTTERPLTAEELAEAQEILRAGYCGCCADPYGARRITPLRGMRCCDH